MTATITAALLMAENNYTTSDITAANLEYIIDNAINHVNLAAGTDISNMTSPGTGTGTVSMTGDESAAVKALSILMLKAYLDRGPNTQIGGLNVSTLIADPQYDLYSKLYTEAITKLTLTSTTSNLARTMVIVK